MTGRLLYLALAAITLAVWALMVGVTGPAIEKAAGGRALFDARLTGYGLEEAQAFLTRLNPAGRDMYLEAQHRLDTIFPPLFALFLVWSFTVLLPRLPAIIMAVVAMAGAGVDLLENARVAALLTAPRSRRRALIPTAPAKTASASSAIAPSSPQNEATVGPGTGRKRSASANSRSQTPRPIRVYQRCAWRNSASFCPKARHNARGRSCRQASISLTHRNTRQAGTRGTSST